MKVASLRALEKYLEESSALSPLYLIASSHAIDRGEIAAQITVALESRYPGTSRSLRRFVGSGGFLSALEELRTNDLFNASRIIFFDKVDELKEEESDFLKRYLSKLPPKLFFILGVESMRGLTPFLPLIKLEGVLLDLLQEKPWERQSRLIEDLRGMAKREHIDISPPVFDFLLQQIGTDWALLKREMEKLLCYGSSKKQVSFEEARCLLAKGALREGWSFAEQLVYHPYALSASSSLDSAAFISLLAQMRYFLRMGRQIALGEEKSPILLKPYQVQKFKEKVQEKGLPFFERGLIALNEAEALAKSSSISSDLLLSRLVINLHLAV